MGCTFSGEDSRQISYCPIKQNKILSHTTTPHKTPDNKANDSSEFLTIEEKRTILRQWQMLNENPMETGIKVYSKIFQLCPDVKDKFPFGKLEGEELLRNFFFRSHATRFMRSVAVTLEGLDELDLIVIPNLIQLGRTHIKVEGFCKDHLDAFEVAMVCVWKDELGADFTKESEIAWNKVLQMITSRVLEGYKAAEAEKRVKQLSIKY